MVEWIPAMDRLMANSVEFSAGFASCRHFSLSIFLQRSCPGFAVAVAVVVVVVVVVVVAVQD